MNIHQLHPQYITNYNGEKTSVVLSISEFSNLIEDIEDLAIVAERREEPVVSHKKLLQELKKLG